jgi:hypothetical protein
VADYFVSGPGEVKIKAVNTCGVGMVGMYVHVWGTCLSVKHSTSGPRTPPGGCVAWKSFEQSWDARDAATIFPVPMPIPIQVALWWRELCTYSSTRTGSEWTGLISGL